MKTDLRFSHDREPVQKCIHIFFGRTGSNVYIFIFLENRTGSLIELRSGSQSSLYHLIGFLRFFFSLGTATLLLLLLLFSHSYSSLFITSTLLFTAITVLSLLVLLFSLLLFTFSPLLLFFPRLLLLFSHGVSLFVRWSHLSINYLIIKTDFN
jgi:hypothetical protein